MFLPPQRPGKGKGKGKHKAGSGGGEPKKNTPLEPANGGAGLPTFSENCGVFRLSCQVSNSIYGVLFRRFGSYILHPFLLIIVVHLCRASLQLHMKPDNFHLPGNCLKTSRNPCLLSGSNLETLLPLNGLVGEGVRSSAGWIDLVIWGPPVDFHLKNRIADLNHGIADMGVVLKVLVRSLVFGDHRCWLR